VTVSPRYILTSTYTIFMALHLPDNPHSSKMIDHQHTEHTHIQILKHTPNYHVVVISLPFRVNAKSFGVPLLSPEHILLRTHLGPHRYQPK